MSVTVLDAGFESPAQSSGGYTYAPTGTAWTFSSGGGIQNNGSPFSSSTANAPEGTQTGFIQGANSISQSISGWAAATYNITFQACQRYGNVQTFQVLIDSTVVGTYQPSGTIYTGYVSSAFTVTAGSHTIEFLGTNTNGGDNTVCIDAVSVNVVTNQTSSDLNLAGYWRFDETSGSAALDSSGNSNTGVMGTGVAFSTSVPSVNFSDTGSYAFNASSTTSIISVPDSTTLRSQNQITLAAWVYWTSSASGGGCIIQKRDQTNFANNFNYSLWIQSTGQLFSQYCDSGNSYQNFTDSGTAVPTNTWSHIAVTINVTAGYVTFYLNGTQNSQFSSTVAMNYTGTAPVTIGNFAGGSYGITGNLDEVRIYNVALTAAQIANLATKKFPNAINVFTGSQSSSSTHPTIVASATSPVNSYHGTASLSNTHATVVSSSHFAVPVYHGTVASTSTHAAISSSSHFAVPTYHGTLTSTSTHSTISSSATCPAPGYHGTMASSGTHATIVSSSHFSVPAYHGTMAVSKQSTISASSTMHAVSYYGWMTTSSINRGFKDMMLIKLNETTVARRRVPFDLVSTTDNISPLTGQTVPLTAIKVYPNGGSEAQGTGNVTEIGGGLYYYEFATGEVATLGQTTVRVNYSGALPYKSLAQIVAFDPYDATRYGLSSLPNAAANASGGIITFGTGAGQMYVDGTGGSYLSLTQPVPASDVSSKTTQNVGDCLSVARAEGAGKWVFAGTVETVYGPDGVQVVRTFTLNDANNPTQRS